MVRCINTEIERPKGPYHKWSMIGLFMPDAGYTEIRYLAIP